MTTFRQFKEIKEGLHSKAHDVGTEHTKKGSPTEHAEHQMKWAKINGHGEHHHHEKHSEHHHVVHESMHEGRVWVHHYTSKDGGKTTQHRIDSHSNANHKKAHPDSHSKMKIHARPSYKGEDRHMR